MNESNFVTEHKSFYI